METFRFLIFLILIIITTSQKNSFYYLLIIKMTTPRMPNPGRFLAGELEARGRTQKYFAELIEKTPEEVSYILTGKRAITLDRAMRIWQALWTSYEPRMRMQNKHDAILLMKNETSNKIFQRISQRIIKLSPDFAIA